MKRLLSTRLTLSAWIVRFQLRSSSQSVIDFSVTINSFSSVYRMIPYRFTEAIRVPSRRERGTGQEKFSLASWNHLRSMRSRPAIVNHISIMREAEWKREANSGYAVPAMVTKSTIWFISLLFLGRWRKRSRAIGITKWLRRRIKHEEKKEKKKKRKLLRGKVLRSQSVVNAIFDCRIIFILPRTSCPDGIYSKTGKLRSL